MEQVTRGLNAGMGGEWWVVLVPDGCSGFSSA